PAAGENSRSVAPTVGGRLMEPKTEPPTYWQRRLGVTNALLAISVLTIPIALGRALDHLLSTSMLREGYKLNDPLSAASILMGIGQFLAYTMPVLVLGVLSAYIFVISKSR